MKKRPVNIDDAKNRAEPLSETETMQTPPQPFIFTEEQIASVNEEFRKMAEDPDYGMSWEKAKRLLKGIK